MKLPNCTIPTPTDSPVLEALRTLRLRADLLDATVSSLRNQLSPVLCFQDVESTGPSKEHPTSCTLAADMWSIVDQLESTAQYLENTQKRICL